MTFGSCYISTPTETTVSAADTPYKASGTTTALHTNGFTHTSNRLTYTGTPTLYFMVQANICATIGSGTSTDFQYHIAKNGTVVTGISVRRNTTSTSVGAMAVGGVVQLATNDYVELWIENLDNTNNITIQEGTLTAFVVG